MFRISLAVLFLFLGKAWTAPVPAKNKDMEPFDALSHKYIKELVENARKEGRQNIDGSDSKENQIPTGTILVYVTSDKQYGKLMIVEYGTDLKIKWVTYHKDGGVATKGENRIVKGTWWCDLDTVLEGDRNSRLKGGDFWWQLKTKTSRSIEFRNGALFAVYSSEK
ncbi:MAG: hypothetical protein R3B84_15755 [Zavarzinella sp.]